MSILKLTYSYLQKIKNKEVSFTMALNHSLNEEGIKEEDLSIVKDVLKSVVNKYVFLKNEVYSSLEKNECSQKEIEVLLIALAMFQYVKNIELNYIISCFNVDKEYFNGEIEDFKLDETILENLLNKIGRKPMFIEEESPMSPKTISLIYSYPEWIVKMMIKHYGFKRALKSIASSRHSLPLVINYNPMMITKDNLDQELFVKNKLASTSFSYIGKEKILDNKLFKENKIFVEDESSQFLIDLLDPRQGESLLFIDESKGVLALDAALRTNDFSKIQVSCKDLANLNGVRKFINRFKLNSIFAFESDMKLLITHVEEKSFDKVLLNPTSSYLGLARKRPDILLTLNRNDLDGIIENQKYEIEEASNFVKEDGILLYAVYTLNHKENEEVVRHFLSKNQEFKLLEERQIFPYNHSDGFYYAILKRGIADEN